MDWSYIAGYFDGEGTVSSRDPDAGGGVKCSLQWFNTHLPSLEAMRDFMGFGVIRTRKARSDKPHYKTAYALVVSRRVHLLIAIEEMLLYAIVKRDGLLLAKQRLTLRMDQPDTWGRLAALGEQEVARLYSSGMTQQAIADHVGVTRIAVKNYLDRHGIAKRTRSETQIRAVRDPEKWAARSEKIRATRLANWADPSYRSSVIKNMQVAQAKRIAARQASRESRDHW